MTHEKPTESHADDVGKPPAKPSEKHSLAKEILSCLKSLFGCLKSTAEAADHIDQAQQRAQAQWDQQVNQQVCTEPRITRPGPGEAGATKPGSHRVN